MEIELTKGDITQIKADAIVNAANFSLLGGGGVDGAIHLPAKYVIHTVGSVWNGDEEKGSKLLANCYYNSLKLAESLNVKTITFPNISTGIYRFPKELAAKIAIDEVENFTSKIIEKVIFVCFDDENEKIYRKLLEE